MYLLNTDILTHAYAGNRHVAARLSGLDSDVATTIVTKVELLRGRMDYLLKANNGSDLLQAQYWLRRTEELLEQIVVVPLDALAVAQFDRIRSVRKIGRADLLIASIALAHGATLVTRNIRHFKQVPGLKVENWLN